jgi:hypothetical protein
MSRTITLLAATALAAAVTGPAASHAAAAPTPGLACVGTLSPSCPDLYVSAVMVNRRGTGPTYVSVRNSTGVAAGGFYVEVSPSFTGDGGCSGAGWQPAGLIWVPGLAGGASVWLSVGHSDYQRTLIVDSTRRVTEMNESNNVATLPVNPGIC